MSDSGIGPTSIFDLVLVIMAAVLVLLAFCLAIRYTFWPGEKSPDHIKRRVLNESDKDPQ